ncbi:MAG TPA: MFS transporter, partial [Negativicutes bacterium]
MSVFNVNKLIDGAKFNNYYVLLYILICAVFVLDGYDLGIYGGVVPDLMKEWSLSPAEVGVIGSYVLVGFAFGALGLGALGDKFGRKNVTVVCIGVFSIFTGMCGLANNATEFSIYRVIAGVAMGGSFPNVIALASDYAPQPIRAFFIASPASTGM